MARIVGREAVQKLIGEGAAVVEVLPASIYKQGHLPRALNIPLARLRDEAAEKLATEKPVIVYCYDFECDLSPRAAARLESLGFASVYDYAAGKLDWISAGLPLEGRTGKPSFVLDFIQRGAPTCALGDRLSDATNKADGVEQIAVIDNAGVVLGVVRKDNRPDRGDDGVEEAMDPAPVTVRPTMAIEEAAAMMSRNELSQVLVTTSEGKLVGFLHREAADHAVHEINSSGRRV